MLTLHGHPFSPHSRKIHFALEELGEPYTYKEVNLRDGEQKTPAFLALNPVGKVPLLLDNDGGQEFALPESGAILWYIANNYGRGILVPTDKRLCARIDQWMFWVASEGHLAIVKPWRVKFFGKMHNNFNQAEYDEAVKQAAGPLSLIERELTGKDYLIGEALSIADIAVFESVWQLAWSGFDLSAYPNVKRWLEAISERPAAKKTRPVLPPPAG